MDTKNIDILHSVAAWKVNASSEDMSKYFFEFPGFERISSGEVSFVLGRKGSGKTAIIQYIDSKSSYNWFSKKINLTAFPTEKFSDLLQQTFLKSNSYVLGWKFVIYSSVLDLMSKNEGLDDDAKRSLVGRGPVQAERKLEQTFNRWRSRSFSASIGDNPYIGGASISSSAELAEKSSATLSEQVDIMEEFILKYIDDSKYFILFDGLDAEFSSTTQGIEYWEQYQILISGLFKACLEVRDIFRIESKNVLPIAFTRDDIFELVHDSDKGKWFDHVYELRWRIDEIRNLLAFRISRAVDSDFEPLTFDRAWKLLFYPNDKIRLRKGGMDGSYKPVFDYMALRSLIRPRDFITYLQICAKITKEHDPSYARINPETVVRSEYAYSCRVRQELVDEIFPLFPDVELLFKSLDKLPHYRYFTYDQISYLLCDEKDDGVIKTNLNTAQILRLLFKYSAVGNSRRFKRKTDIEATYYRTFSHIKPRAALDIRKPMTIHSSLFASVFSSRAEMYSNTADKNVNDFDEPPPSILPYETED